ncbi:NAD(P)H-dependent oxidoreductase [Cobetia sp. cqz5-12]|uniref:NADPH-dependent FMN reductase n=1 Tax=Cobetia sp. cqz5-12 TaxID=2609415 RepID=UPI001902E50F|nr:NAD(P)H-dependent oxidoreductase [Cobetia sp. cqz5-12]QQK65257.1 NAD(P)H-dependent oxidoreductase [Cobetia sp. cqz5-12]
MSIRLLAFAASTRKASVNRRLIERLAHHARQEGAEVSLLDLNDFPMPLYDGDSEEANGRPASADRLQEMLASHQGLLLATPEYNGFFSPLLKNTFDWLSRPAADGQSGMDALRGMPVGIVSASPGAMGGMRALPFVRLYLNNLGMLVAPQQIAVSRAGNAFHEDGSLDDEGQDHALAAVARQVIDLASLRAS